jgi:hypothetical protein
MLYRIDGLLTRPDATEAQVEQDGIGEGICSGCGGPAELGFELVNSYEIMTDRESKVTLTGVRTIASYRFGEPAAVKAGLCRRCLARAKRRDAFILGFGYAFVLGFFWILGALLCMLVVSIFDSSHQARYMAADFAIGGAASALAVAAMLASGAAKARKAYPSKEEADAANAASIARHALNKRRKPSEPRWFTMAEWKLMLASGVHPDSEPGAGPRP